MQKNRQSMSHEHHHHHHHHAEAADVASLKKVYIASVVLNLAFVLCEAAVGVWGNSLGLLSDAGHNLSDVFSLLLALIALRLASTRSTKKLTYGYRKGSVVISLLNAIILLVAVGAIFVESIHKFLDPAEVNGGAVAWTAGVGILVNGFTAFLLMRHRKEDLNAKGAFLHMAADTLVSVGVVVSGIVIAHTGWNIIDPIIGIVVALIILIGTWDLLSESLRLSIDAVPEGIDSDEIREHIREIPGVIDVHHLHIWPISTSETALTAHAVLSVEAEAEETVASIKAELREHGIVHATIETEHEGHPCPDKDCC